MSAHLLYILINRIKGLAREGMEYLAKLINAKDVTLMHVVITHFCLLAKKDQEYSQKYRGAVEKLQQNTVSQDLKKECQNLIDVMDGKRLLFYLFGKSMMNINVLRLRVIYVITHTLNTTSI